MSDIFSFLNKNNIEYKTSGKNIGKFIGIKECPWCRDDTYHLGMVKQFPFNLNCWKCGKHTFIDFIKIISKCNYETAKKILDKYKKSDIIVKNEVEADFKKYYHPTGFTNIFPDYAKRFLEKRRYNYLDLIKKYDIMYSGNIGRWKNRIIFPIKENNQIVNYAGRSLIDDENIIPYIYDLNENNPPVLKDDLIFNLDNCKKDYIIIVEGIFDCLRIGDDCIALLTVQFSKKQLMKLRRFKKFYLMFDNDDVGQRMVKILEKYLVWAESIQYIKYNVKDPDKLSDKDVRELRTLL